ncbi:MAG: MFS transporter [Chloroflexi bacterium]|nr:MFS transporter [Chloroflexota bacterium]
MAAANNRIFTPNFFYLSFCTFGFFISFTLFFPTLPLLIKSHGGDAAIIGLMVGASSIVSLAIRPVTGRLTDRYGRRRFILVGCLCMLLSSIGYDFAPNLGSMWPVRLMAGAGIAFFFTASTAFMGDISPSGQRGRAMAYLGIFNNISMALGPALGIWLIKSDRLGGIERRLEDWLPGSGSSVTDQYNFAILFVVATVFALVGVVLSLRLKEVHVPTRKAKESPLEMVQSMLHRDAAVPAILNGLVTSNFVALNIFIPLFGEEIGMANPGLYYTVYALAMILFRLIGGQFLDRYPRQLIMIPSLFCLMTATLMLAFIQTEPIVYVTAVLVGVGSGVVQPTLQAYLVDKAKGVRLGAASGTFAIGMDVGVFGGGAVMGRVQHATDSYTVPWTTAGLCSGVAMLIAIYVASKELPRRKAPAAPGTALGRAATGS